jgi:hypothetical protein
MYGTQGGPNSASFGRVTPSGGIGVDQSVSLARRSTAFDTPPPKAPTGPVPLAVSPEQLKPQPVLNQDGNARIVRIVLIAAMVIAVAVAMYIFVKPQ